MAKRARLQYIPQCITLKCRLQQQQQQHLTYKLWPVGFWPLFYGCYIWVFRLKTNKGGNRADAVGKMNKIDFGADK